MGQNEDWVMRPIAEKMCSYESVKNYTIDLADIAAMNEALDVRVENERRYRKATER